MKHSFKIVRNPIDGLKTLEYLNLKVPRHLCGPYFITHSGPPFLEAIVGRRLGAILSRCAVWVEVIFISSIGDRSLPRFLPRYRRPVVTAGEIDRSSWRNRLSVLLGNRRS
jgi:hypothetical protein